MASRWAPSRSALVIAGLLIAAAVVLVLERSQSQATTDGSAYEIPLVTDTDPRPGVVATTLVADEANVRVSDIGGGITAHAQTFNGTIPGPTFELNVGDTVIVHYINHLSRESGIHWHGIELSNGMDGTPFTQNQVEPGGSYLYKFTVTRPGLFWYHPHHHSSTNQVFKGLYGMIIVKDPNEDALQASGTLPSDADTHPIVLSDTTVCKDPGQNPSHTYHDNVSNPGNTEPWAGGGVDTLPPQQDPSVKNLCEGPDVAPNPYPVDEDGAARPDFNEGDIPNIQTALHHGRTNEGQTVLTNGKNVGPRPGGAQGEGYAMGNPDPNAEILDATPGQGVRLELLNASAVRYMRLQLTKPDGTKQNMFRVGGEGGLLNNAELEGGVAPLGGQANFNTKYTQGEILLPPGSRADVVIPLPSNVGSGVYTLWTRDYSRTGQGFSNIPTVPVMHIRVGGIPINPAYTISQGTPLRAATGDPVEDISGLPTDNPLPPGAKLGTASPNITFDASANNELRVNNVFGTHDVSGDYKLAGHLGSTRYAQQGDILALNTKNNTLGAHHPFHEHGFSIQPISLVGPGANDDFIWPYPEFRDNVDIPPGYTLFFRMRLDPRPMPDGTTPGGALGRWLFHCHIFFHATDGMLSELVVTSPTVNERPDIDMDNYFPRVPRRHQGRATGHFGDPDGNLVSLSASLGTVTETGSGSFSWKLRKVTAGDKLVYITATDTNGLKGQTAFRLNAFPGIKRLRVKPTKFKVGGGVTPNRGTVSAKRGAKIRFNLTDPGTVRFSVKRIVGHRARGKAVKFRRTFIKSGNKKVKFTGKVRGAPALRNGRYQLTAVATDTSGLRSAKSNTTFKVVG